MAPDLNAVAAGGRWDYSTPGSSGYDVPNITYADPQNRCVKVINIGAGFSSILQAYQIQKQCQNVELVIYEKNADIGGTWFENRYPGCACDIPSHAYTFNFALYPDWPRLQASSADIRTYLDKVCNCFGLRKYMTFNTQVVEAIFDEQRGKWTVKLRRVVPQSFDTQVKNFRREGNVEEWEDECDLLLYGTGLLNEPKWPDIPGLENFKGRVAHTARWPKDYTSEQWKTENVAVIGSGSSSIQVVPTMQVQAKHIDVFVRTAVWFVALDDKVAQNYEYTDEQKNEFREHPENMVALAKGMEEQFNSLWYLYYSGSEAQKQGQEMFKKRMAAFIKDERLLKGFTPKFELGCRRVAPGDPYMLAIQQPNVDVHFTHVETVTPDGVIGGDGVERKCDTIVSATGFDVTYRPRFPIIGKNGVDLREKWKDIPQGYLGLAVPDMPNFIIFAGPTWPVMNGTIMGPLKQVTEYTVKIIKKMQAENIKSWVPRQDITDQFNEHVQEWVKHSVFKDNCRSWYKDNETGRVNAIWPGSAQHYVDVIKEPRYEDFEIKYHYKNQWAMLGMGFSVRNHTKDFTPYLSLDQIDPKWMEMMGMPRNQANEKHDDAQEKSNV